MRENYKILGIEETATDEEVRRAYQTLKTKYREKWLKTEGQVFSKM